MSFSANNKSETSSPSRGDGSAVHNVEFEVHGRVQGVFFRAETEKKAKQLGLVGWVRNTDQDTVEGQIQGSKEAVDQMKDWLAHTGSRGSKIERADFKVENEVSKKEFTGFKVRH